MKIRNGLGWKYGILTIFFTEDVKKNHIFPQFTPGTLKFVFSCFLIMIFFTVNPIMFGEVLPAKKHIIC
jgi:hypothetical protein